MKRNAVGFYWTLPVPWAGFTQLSKDIEDAAKASRTICFQRALILEYAKKHGLALVHEEAFLEINPDRGSKTIRDALNKAATVCRAHGAIMLFVDFSAVQGWRSHHPMLEWLDEAEVESLPIEAAPIIMDAELFDPHAHFGEWRNRQSDWMAGKQIRAEKALARAQELQTEGLKYPFMARKLNEEGLRSLSGRPWTAESLRKVLTAPH